MAHDVRTTLTIKLFGRPITELTRSVASDAVLSALTGGSTVVDVGGCVYHRGMSSSWAIKAPVSSEIESLLSLCYKSTAVVVGSCMYLTAAVLPSAAALSSPWRHPPRLSICSSQP